MREAIDLPAAEGHSVGAFYPRVLGPFPVDPVKRFTANAPSASSCPKSTSPASSPGSSAARCGIQVESHAKCDGLPFTADDMLDVIMERAAQ